MQDKMIIDVFKTKYFQIKLVVELYLHLVI